MRHVSDRVHGDICLSTMASRLIACPEVRRLDGIRQLGGCVFVYPSASHTRLEHSIGVAHLAKLMGQHLRAQCDHVSDMDVQCLEIAGLLHDVGHGPFSHLFEDYVREHVDPSWGHERVGEIITETLLMRMQFAERDIVFVKLLIAGLPTGTPVPPETGRDDRVRFLCDVVHNCSCGIDVDKLDYLLRDALAVFGATQAVDVTRIIRASRVIEGNILAFDQRVAGSIEQIYELRTRLHMKLYQHREVLVVEHLIKEALVEQNVKVNELNELMKLTDVAILDRLSEAQFARLYTHPRMHRLPFYDGSIDVRPACTACGSLTEASDAFCGACGSSTEDRSFMSKFLADGTCARVPPLAVVSADEIASRVNELIGGRCVRVLMRDIHTGVPRMASNGWLTYTVLSAVTFCDARGCRVRLTDTSARVHHRFMYFFADDRENMDDLASTLNDDVIMSRVKKYVTEL